MDSSGSKLANLITELHNRVNETKIAFDQAIAELEKQKLEQEQTYQKKLQKLATEREKCDEEKAVVMKITASASPILNLNVGGETMSTSRATVTLDETSLLAKMFSGKYDDKLMKDTNGNIFLDYDPVLFKFLLNQLRIWSDPSVKRIFRLPIGSEHSFLELVRLLKFDEQYINRTHDNITNASSAVTLEQCTESFGKGSSSSIQLSNNDQTCQNNIGNQWNYVLGTLAYSTGIHRIRLKFDKGTTSNTLVGICSQNHQPAGPIYYDKPTTHGWFIHGYAVTNGRGSHPGWQQVNVGDLLELTINCNERSLTILNETNQTQQSMQVNINEAPFPWCLFVLFNHSGDQMSLQQSKSKNA